LLRSVNDEVVVLWTQLERLLSQGDVVSVGLDASAREFALRLVLAGGMVDRLRHQRVDAPRLDALTAQLGQPRLDEQFEHVDERAGRTSGRYDSARAP